MSSVTSILSRARPFVRTAARHVKTTGGKPLGAMADFTVRANAESSSIPSSSTLYTFFLLFFLVYCNIYSLFPFSLRHSSSNVTNPARPWITPAHCSDVPSVHGSRGSLPCVHPCDAGFFSQYFSRFNFPKYLSKKERVINAKRQRDLLLAVFRLFHLLD